MVVQSRARAAEAQQGSTVGLGTAHAFGKDAREEPGTSLARTGGPGIVVAAGWRAGNSFVGARTRIVEQRCVSCLDHGYARHNRDRSPCTHMMPLSRPRVTTGSSSGRVFRRHKVVSSHARINILYLCILAHINH